MPCTKIIADVLTLYVDPFLSIVHFIITCLAYEYSI